MLRVIELFSGIGAQAEALKELGLDYEVVATSDIDKHANLGYEAIHGKVNNLGDITKIEHLPECDLLTYSYPCTSISLAGKREGMVEGSGTASSLLWEVGRLLADMNERKILPEVLLMENVDAVLNKVNKPEFDRWCNILSEMGYCNSYTIMNAKDYGTPQNRKRIFMVSTLTMGEFVFPDPCPDGRVLRDVLEQDVPESYFLSEKRLATFKRHKERNDAKGNGFGFKIHEITDEERERERGDFAQAVMGQADRYCQTWVGIPKTESQSESGIIISGKVEPDFNQSGKIYDTEGMSATIRTPSGGGLIPKIEVPPIENAGELNIPNWHNTARSVAGVNGISPTIITAKGGGSGVVVAGNLTDSNVVQDRQVYDADGISPTVITPKGSGSKTKIAWPNGTNGTVDAKEGDCVKIYPDPSRENSGSNVREGESNALNTYNGCGAGTPVSDGEKLRIRYLTPRECLRLQAFPDDAIDKLQAVLSKSALYKVAGNSIAVCCLKAIFKGIYIDKTFKKDKQSRIESFF